MDHYLYRLVGSFGTLITTVFIIDFDKHSMGVNFFLLFVVFYTTSFLALDGVRVIAQRPRSFDRTNAAGKEKISKYLISQLEASGSVAIFSKDLTWVKKGGDAEKLLIDKSKNGELTIFLEKEIPIAHILKESGAEVRIYGSKKIKGFNPKSRFTILDHRTIGARIMVGVPLDGTHLIKNYGKDDFEVVDLAKDFIKLLEATSRVPK